jgi:hypothetical protein
VDLVSIDAKTEAVQPRDLCEVGVEHHVKKAFICGALFDTARRIGQGIRKITELQIIAEIIKALLEFGESRNARGDRWLHLGGGNDTFSGVGGSKRAPVLAPGSRE